MSSEGEPGDKLRVGLLKNVTGHDRIQARDLYKSASEFRFKANIDLCFNEIPGVDDSSGGIARRHVLVNFLFKFVDELFLANEKKLDDSLHTKFARKDYGARLLKHFIDLFAENGLDFQTPQCVKLASFDYIGENDVVGDFMTKHYRTPDSGLTRYFTKRTGKHSSTTRSFTTKWASQCLGSSAKNSRQRATMSRVWRASRGMCLELLKIYSLQRARTIMRTMIDGVVR